MKFAVTVTLVRNHQVKIVRKKAAVALAAAAAAAAAAKNKKKQKQSKLFIEVFEKFYYLITAFTFYSEIESLSLL